MNYLKPIHGQQCITHWGVGIVLIETPMGVKVRYEHGDPVFARHNVELIPIGRQQHAHVAAGVML